MKSRKSEKRKKSAILSGIIQASLRYASVQYVILDGAPLLVTRHILPPNAPLQKRRGTVFVHWSQLMTLGTFQAVKFGGSKGGPGASAASRGGSRCHVGSWGSSRCHVGSWGGSGCLALEDGSSKEGEPKASGAERAGNIDHTYTAVHVTINHSKARRTRQACSDEFASIPYWRNCTFT